MSVYVQFGLHVKCVHRCQDPTELGSFSSALLCAHCNNGRSPIVPDDPLGMEEGGGGGGCGWSCLDCGRAADGGDSAVAALCSRLSMSLDETKSEDGQVKLKDFMMDNSREGRG